MTAVVHVPTTRRVLRRRYELIEVIGRGGMSEVFRAHDRRMQQDVAVKFLQPVYAQRLGARDRFEREMRIATALEHPNIVSVLDASRDENGLPFLVMELLPGRTFADDLSAGPVRIERVRGVANDVLRALQHVHEMGVVHGDVKPSNILLTETGVAKLGDFGIAAAVGDIEPMDDETVMGTVPYISPQRIRGQPADFTDDLYSLGVVLWEGITGRHPYGCGSPALVNAKAHGRPLPRLSGTPSRGDDRLAQVIDRAVSHDRQGRPSSAATMAGQLSGAVGHVPVTCTTRSDARPRRRPPGWSEPAPRNEQPTAPMDPPRQRSGLLFAWLLLLSAVTAGVLAAGVARSTIHMHAPTPRDAKTAHAPPFSPIVDTKR